MEVGIHIFDDETHVYDYFCGRVVPLAVAAQPIWRAVETAVNGAEWILATYRAPDEAAAEEAAVERRIWTDSTVRAVRVEVAR